MKTKLSRSLIQICLLAAALLALPAAVQAQFTYTTNNGTITITGYTGSGGAVSIPAIINGLPVASIGDDAFVETGLTSVTIPNSVTNIGDYAFANNPLTNVTIPNSVTSIGDGAFEACGGLTSVYLSGNAPAVVAITSHFDREGDPYLDGSFAYDPAIIYYLSHTTGWSNNFGGLPTVMLDGPPQFGTTANGWNYVSDHVQNTLITGYAGSSNAVVIPSTVNGLPVTGIAPYAFAFTSITNVTIPDSVTSIGDSAFDGCLSLTGITIPNSVMSIGDDAFAGSGLKNITIPDSITSIGNNAFYACQNLTSVTIGNGVTNIGGWAFEFCNNLTNVTIPDSVTSIGDSAFDGCLSLTGITIPNSVMSIGDDAFAGSGLKNITIPDSITSIGDAAFQYCYSLAHLTIGNGVTSIGGWAFSETALTSVMIPNGVTNIGDQAFAYSGLTSVTIGNNVSNIGTAPFDSCQSLITITVAENNPTYSSVNGVLFDKIQTTLIQYPAGNTATSYTIPNSVTTVGDGAFAGCLSLTSVMIPDSVTGIGDSAFTGCWSLTSVTIPNSVTGIGDGAFNNCGSLTSVTIGNSVTSIGNNAFYACQNLTSVTIGDGVINIGDYAFGWCDSLTNIYFTGNAPTTGSSVFFIQYSDTNYGYDPTTVYYLSGTVGWSSTFAGRPTAHWFLPQPLILNQGPGFGVQSNQFDFTISWATNVPVVVEACTNLANPVWLPVSTNTLVGGTSYFSDPQPANLPGRFYRLRSP